MRISKVLKHDLVTPFSHDILRNLEEKDPLFAHGETTKDTPMKRVTNASIAFPFATWDAEATDPISAQAEIILEWQRRLARRAKLEWDPLMFHFVSEGSEWKVYACYLQSVKKKTKEDVKKHTKYVRTSSTIEYSLKLKFRIEI
jgi:hypothetical protein